LSWQVRLAVALPGCVRAARNVEDELRAVDHAGNPSALKVAQCVGSQIAIENHEAAPYEARFDFYFLDLGRGPITVAGSILSRI